jgi:hypothetical protein
MLAGACLFPSIYLPPNKQIILEESTTLINIEVITLMSSFSTTFYCSKLQVLQCNGSKISFSCTNQKKERE